MGRWGMSGNAHLEATPFLRQRPSRYSDATVRTKTKDADDGDDGLSNKDDDDDDAASGAPSDLAARALMREPISVVATYY